MKITKYTQGSKGDFLTISDKSGDIIVPLPLNIQKFLVLNILRNNLGKIIK